jgi:hypothetical protein
MIYEFGKQSPIGVSCSDKIIKLEDLQISEREIHVLNKIFNHYDDLNVSEEDIIIMERLDKYLDIPLVQAVLDESASYQSFHRLVENDCSIIPKKYKQNPELVKDTIIHHSFKTFQKAIFFCSYDVHFLKLAIIYGCVDIVNFLLNEMKDQVKEEEDEYMMCTIACKYGQLECLQVLHKNGFRWNDLAANLAASYGRLDCLRYLHENGYVLNMDARAAAYANNRQECLQYLIDHGCPWIEGYISVMFDLFI